MVNEQETKQPWTWKTAVEKAKREVQEKGFPMPKAPRGFGEEYEFPDEAENLPDIKLANKMLQLAAWHGYVIVQAGWVDAEYSALSRIFELVIGEKMIIEAKKYEKKVWSKDSLRAVVIMGEENLRQLERSLVELETRRKYLMVLVDLYSTQWAALSREQTRRADEKRMIGGTNF